MKYFENIISAGGIIGTGPLGELVRHAHSCNSQKIEISHRQNFCIHFSNKQDQEKFKQAFPGTLHTLSPENKNIMSSAPMSKIQEGATAWLSESLIKEAISSIKKIKNNWDYSVVDPKQSFVPLFESRLNVVASRLVHHWYIVFRNEYDISISPFLVSTHLLTKICNTIYENKTMPIDDLWKFLKSKFGHKLMVVSNMSLEISYEERPRFEGLHKFADQVHWLGIFREDNNWPVLLLDELSYLCRKNSIGHIDLTPYHSLIVKEIPSHSLREWKDFLGRHGVVLRHNQNALSWRMSGSFGKLKKQLHNMIYKNDTGNADQIITIGKEVQYFESDILILVNENWFKNKYTLYFHSDFIRRSKNIMKAGVFRTKTALAEKIKEISVGYRKKFLHSDTQESKEETISIVKKKSNPENKELQVLLWQCPDCLNVYDSRYGDPHANIKCGIEFETIKDEYSCPVCELSAKHFHVLQTKTLDSTLKV